MDVFLDDSQRGIFSEDAVSPKGLEYGGHAANEACSFEERQALEKKLTDRLDGHKNVEDIL